jgi:hypothetical protein
MFLLVLYADPQNMKVEETLLYGSTKNRTRRNIFYADPQNMKVEETLLYGSTKNRTRRNIFYALFFVDPNKRVSLTFMFCGSA